MQETRYVTARPWPIGHGVVIPEGTYVGSILVADDCPGRSPMVIADGVRNGLFAPEPKIQHDPFLRHAIPSTKSLAEAGVGSGSNQPNINTDPDEVEDP